MSIKAFLIQLVIATVLCIAAFVLLIITADNVVNAIIGLGNANAASVYLLVLLLAGLGIWWIWVVVLLLRTWLKARQQKQAR